MIHRLRLTPVPNDILFDPMLRPEPKLLYAVLLYYRINTKPTEECKWPGRETLAKLCGYGVKPKHIAEWTDYLERKGLLKIERHGTRRTIYHLLRKKNMGN